MRHWIAAVALVLALSACVGPMAPVRDALIQEWYNGREALVTWR